MSRRVCPLHKNVGSWINAWAGRYWMSGLLIRCVQRVLVSSRGQVGGRLCIDGYMVSQRELISEW